MLNPETHAYLILLGLGADSGSEKLSLLVAPRPYAKLGNACYR